MSESQWFTGWKGAAFVSKNLRISAFPVSVAVPLSNVASGAHSVIIRSTFFVDEALCQTLSIWSIAYKSASLCTVWFEAEFWLEPPQAVSDSVSTRPTRPVTRVHLMFLTPPFLPSSIDGTRSGRPICARRESA